jgi:putative restriction endonuclease
MRNFWWVNQKQTYQHEVPGGYMWSPKRQKGGRRNHSYDLMTKVKPGDVVFSFAGGHIKAIGLAKTYCYEFPKPTEFGNAGNNWDYAGWRIEVGFKEIPKPFRPRDFNHQVQPLLAGKYAPLKADGNGNQAYLFKINEHLGMFLASKAGTMATRIAAIANQVHEETGNYFVQQKQQHWEDVIEERIIQTVSSETTRVALIESRVGQGRFRKELSKVEKQCRITKVDRFEHLIASHIKPWRDGDNDERLDPENGLMLTPTIDHLFDRGFITFDEQGQVLIAEVADEVSLKKMGVSPIVDSMSKGFSEGQRGYLDYHREFIFLK